MIPMLLSLCLILVAFGCRSNPPVDRPPAVRVLQKHPTTLKIDSYDLRLADQAPADDVARLGLYGTRWPVVQRAVAYWGTTHRDAFYGSRAYWHTGSTRGLGWALFQPDDLNDPFYIDGRGNAFIQGDVNQDIEIAGNAVIHIQGDLNATLDLRGVCEVIIAGNLTKDATIICDGQLELFVGGDCLGILGSTGSSTIIIDGDAAGTIQAGAPATSLTVTGDLAADIPPPKNKDTILTLRVDGYTPMSKLETISESDFTRITATLGLSDIEPGLYPSGINIARPKTKWVVLEQLIDDSINAD